MNLILGRKMALPTVHPGPNVGDGETVGRKRRRKKLLFSDDSTYPRHFLRIPHEYGCEDAAKT